VCQERVCPGSSIGSLGAMGMEKLWSSWAWTGAQESRCMTGPGHGARERVGPASRELRSHMSCGMAKKCQHKKTFK